jgi:hypothetical protein
LFRHTRDFGTGAKIGHFFPFRFPEGARGSIFFLNTALPPPRGLLLGQAPGAKAAFFHRTTQQKIVKRLSSTAFCRIGKIIFGAFFGKCLRMCGWVGHISPKNYRRPGTKGFAFIYFLPSGMRSTQKAPGAPARHQASFPIALKLFTKTFLIGSMNRV